MSTLQRIIGLLLLLCSASFAEVAHYSVGGGRTTGDTHRWNFTVNKGTAANGQYYLRYTGGAWYDGVRVTVTAGVITENASFYVEQQQSGIAGAYDDQIVYEWTTKVHARTFDGVYNSSGVLVKALSGVGSSVTWTVAKDGLGPQTIQSSHSLTLAGADPNTLQLNVFVSGAYADEKDTLMDIYIEGNPAHLLIKAVKGVPLGSPISAVTILTGTGTYTESGTPYLVGKTVRAVIVGKKELSHTMVTGDFVGNQFNWDADFGNIGQPTDKPKPPPPNSTPRPGGTPTPGPVVPGDNPLPAQATPPPTSTPIPKASTPPPGPYNPSTPTRPGVPTGQTDFYAAVRGALKDEGDSTSLPSISNSSPDDLTATISSRGKLDEVQGLLNDAMYDAQTAKHGVGDKLMTFADTSWIPTSGLGTVTSIDMGSTVLMGTTMNIRLDLSMFSGSITVIRATLLFVTAIAFMVICVRTVREYM